MYNEKTLLDNISRYPKWVQKFVADLVRERDLWKAKVLEQGAQRENLWDQIYKAAVDVADDELDCSIEDISGIDVCVELTRSAEGWDHVHKWAAEIYTMDDHGHRSEIASTGWQRQVGTEEEILVDLLDSIRANYYNRNRLVVALREAKGKLGTDRREQ